MTLEIGQAALAVALPLVFFFVPAISWIPWLHMEDILFSGSRLMLWNIGLIIVTTFVAAALQLPVVSIAIVGIGGFLVALVVRRKSLFSLESLWGALAIIIPITLMYAAFSVPYLLKFDGLPSGDSQKTIIWANRVLELQSLPDYNTSFKHLNRDAGDFFTPGLHTFTALLMKLSPQPLISVGLISIVFAAALAWIAAAIFRELVDDAPHTMPPLLAAFFVITNTRFLRYVREPGYHFQNIVGELLLFGMILLGIRLLRRFSWGDAILGFILTFALVVTHQFSVFVAFFALLPLALLFLFHRRSKKVLYTILAGLGVLAVAAIPFGLYAKIPHLLTTDAHLASLTPSLASYPLTMGTAWFFFGIAGLALLVWNGIKHRSSPRLAFILATLAILALSQGPRIFLDIPPVRALFYSVVPLSICGAYFVMNVRHLFTRTYTGAARFAALTVLFVLVAIPAISSVNKAYAGSTLASAVNSTLTAEELYLGDFISHIDTNSGVVIDDYNKRSASWLVLSGNPMFTRIAANISRQMDEASQSKTRMELYLRQLEFEKIFSLPSQPYVTSLFPANNIRWVAATDGVNVDGFMQNPALRESARADDIVLFESQGNANELSARESWLLKPSTLANDIGDREDTFSHLPISLRTPRLSSPLVVGNTTYRTTTSPIIPVEINVGDYIRALWDQDASGSIDAGLEFYIKTLNNDVFTLTTPNGATYTVSSGEGVHVDPKDLIVNERGFLVFQLTNNVSSTTNIDIIALGLAQIP